MRALRTLSALARFAKLDYPLLLRLSRKTSRCAAKQNRMNDKHLLAELARYLESQIPGAAGPQPTPATPPPETLVRALYERQLIRNSAGASLLKRRQLPPEPVRSLDAIPAIPVAAYKHLELTTVAPEDRVAVFHSSGTAGQQPSRHHHSAATLQIYELAIEAWFKRQVLGHLPWAWRRRHPESTDRIRMLSLTPSPLNAPHSSLAYMIASLFRRFGSTDSCFAGVAGHDGWQVDHAQVLRSLRSAPGAGPVILFGTAFNFVHLLDELTRRGESFALPDGSQVMETGGYKGRSREVPKEELHDMISTRLGVPADRIVCEYGMAELSSQAYDTCGDSAQSSGSGRRFLFPPWCHPTVVSPETGQEVSVGQAGLLRIADLSNVASVLCVQTEDLATRHEAGITLLGRSGQAEPRGCSLMAASQ